MIGIGGDAVEIGGEIEEALVVDKIGDHVGYIAEESPSGAPLLAAASIEQQRQVINQEAERLDIAPAAAMAVFVAESAPHDLPGPYLVLNFEPHILSEHLFTHAVGNQGIFFRHFGFGSPPWTDQRWRPDPSQPWRSLGGNQDNERQAIDLACHLFGREATLRAVSMGPGQIMGFCHDIMGYPDARTMFDAWRADPLAAVRGFFRYIETVDLAWAIRERNWEAFAAGYNGAGNVGAYAERIATAVAYMESDPQPTGRVAATRQIAG